MTVENNKSPSDYTTLPAPPPPPRQETVVQRWETFDRHDVEDKGPWWKGVGKWLSGSIEVRDCGLVVWVNGVGVGVTLA